ncbi:Hypothetical predicted protein [Cloeon dipterum]|uniref:Uncharacterized protein n=1 Tax=Cloeon dipterum TaxID=197152 RepID=A0A8S1CIX4_9INSE|nr:Hypothetical predicted protein [Cloeon dipterum]
MEPRADLEPCPLSVEELQEIENIEEPVLQKLDKAISRIEMMNNDVRPLVDVLHRALNTVVNVTEILYKQGFFGVNKGLEMLLNFLMDGRVLLEFGAVASQFLRAIIAFLECVKLAINLYQHFKERRMSTQKGNTSRTRAQKHKNSFAFKNDLHDKTPKNLQIASMRVANVCEHCKGVIEWKIKYKKYKPLNAPAKCPKCQQKTVKHAYHTYCSPCAREAKMCPKEMQELLKSLPERKRRTFLRFLASKNKDAADQPDKKPENLEKELSDKLNELKLAANKEDDDDFSDGYSDSDVSCSDDKNDDDNDA